MKCQWTMRRADDGLYALFLHGELIAAADDLEALWGLVTMYTQTCEA